MGKEIVVTLKYHADFRAHLVGGAEHLRIGPVGDIPAQQLHIAYADIARIEQFKAVEAPEECRFATSGWAYKRDKVAFFYIYRDIVEHSVASIIKTLAEIFHDDQGFFRQIVHSHTASLTENIT
jgi:hypothetical protein